MNYYDDNFGEYEIESQNDVDFYFATQRKSVRKKCSICGQTVKLLPHYDKCDRCIRILENGGDPYY